ncbi:hypothetical protein L226DRAFT_615581 [Lentinus tigrinus ALCF2SS1-7]|uniref:Uncharacterized protein n=1 Tax=Lentinus tigrinus ALCF2SS1-6 TaxID=1328759 RepID=A0A5C2RVG5_9APHY|nr:hypothetical protein L227DRAFT_615407 [Lentinus tigrinus ALCF2SS1-6]RPD71295.1 hypothetical protein L226DRAFT_615581 [Lentinus tigrinus ALCF2SS1-7]
MAALAKLFTNSLDLIQAIDSLSKVRTPLRSQFSLTLIPIHTCPSLLQNDLLPHVPVELRAHARWLQATVVNSTPYKIRVDDSYFNSGKYFKEPQDIEPHSQMTFSCCNSAFGAGCAGATRFEADVEDGHLGFVLGWTNPAAGSQKVSAVADYHPTKMGYDRADNRVFTETSKYGVVFIDEKGDGKVKNAKLKFTAKPHGQEPVYIIESFVEDIKD